jgi:hypothetical protein
LEKDEDLRDAIISFKATSVKKAKVVGIPLCGSESLTRLLVPNKCR